ncbi:hypothetical protein [Phaeovulum sp.]|uniref:hypothetical protein n=1 Tax=Phaeovulum sp. TaxID=2934796 RepID=UPI0035652597
MKRLIALTTAAAFALTAVTATPAAAWGKNEQQALSAIVGLAILGTIINQASNSKAQPAPSRPSHNPAPPRDDRWEQRSIWLPGSCVRSVRINSRSRDVVSAQCLRDEGVTARLPSSCAFDIRTDWGTQRVYGTSCLADSGFRVSRR